jgi:hypothetical protein
MTASGVFPKVDGDVLYSTDINMINPKLLGNYIPTTATLTVNSGTTLYTTIGSIVYPGTGSLQISSFININSYVGTGENIATNARFRISGTAGLNNLVSPVMGQTANAGTENHIYYDFILTSGVITASGGNIGSKYAIFFEANTDTNVTARIGTIKAIGY